jgi:hypothetical protein
MIKYLLFGLVLISCSNNNYAPSESQLSIYYQVIASQDISNNRFCDVNLKTVLEIKTGNILYIATTCEGVSISR